MSRISWILAAFAGTALAAPGAIAQAQSPSSEMKLSQAECTTLWNKANGSASTGLSMTQAQPYVIDFKKVDANSDGTLSENEFKQGCDSGLVKSSAATGAGSGASGSSSSGSNR